MIVEVIFSNSDDDGNLWGVPSIKCKVNRMQIRKNFAKPVLVRTGPS